MGEVIRWDKFLPKMVLTLRLLLVEPDDSTRQIIALLLRKCNYEVTVVSDGLKAWELLNSKPCSIDLVLTEVELPSISGFALLSLTADHQACKNIPVIMMSAHDSVTTVYKCMLRGAADFLVKPVRKNELNNLWQHVWRRQSSTGNRNEPNEESKPQQKVEATAENNATSNRSSGYTACVKRNRESIEKGTDAHSSCTKPDTERVDVNRLAKEAVDLIGSFDSFPKTSYTNSLNQVDHPSSMLELSLRSNPSSPVDHLRQSHASAFSRYINRTQQSPRETYNSDTQSAPVGSSRFPSPKQRVFPVPVEVRGLGFENPGATHTSVLPSVFSIQPGSSPQSQDSSGHQEPSSSFQVNIFNTSLPEARSSSQDRPATEQTENSIGSGSNGRVNLVSDASNTPQLTQREAALNKFRMKRKDRCYNKKVRYENRKKLAEKRPRVKGQFARQVQTSNALTVEAGIECGN